MRQIVSCIPEISEGRRQEVVDEIVAAIRAEGVQVIEVATDAPRNRSSITFVGDLAGCERAAFAAIAAAADRIDMALAAEDGSATGMGAADAVPFVPIQGATVAECVGAAKRLAERVAAELDLPVYLFGAAALHPERAKLPGVRTAGYAVIRDAIASDTAFEPDFGPRRLGPAGATAIGARPPRVDLNLYLDTNQLPVAEACARAVRESSGGLVGVEATSLVDDARGTGRVSASILASGHARVHQVAELVRAEATRHGARITATEIEGLLPQRVLLDAAAWYLQLADFDPAQVLETRLADPSRTEATAGLVPTEFLAALASDAPTPGGGSVAAMAGALGAALTCMVANLTVGREKFMAVDKDMRQVRERAGALQRQLVELMAADSAAFDDVMGAYRLPRGTNEEADARRDAVQDALRKAIEVPLETMRQGVEVLRLARAAAEMGNANAVSDAGVSAYMAHGGIQSASLNVEINVMGLRDLEEGDRYRRAAVDLLREAQALVDEVDRRVRARIAG